MPRILDHPVTPAPTRLTPVDVIGVLVLVLAGPVLLASGAALAAAAPVGPQQTLVHVLGLAAGVAGALLLAWCALGALGVAVMAIGQRLGRPAWTRCGARLAPGVMRRVACAVLGLQLIGAPAAWASGEPAAVQSAPEPAAVMQVDASWSPSPSPVRTPSPAWTAQRSPTDALPDPSWTPHSPTPAPPGARAEGRRSAERATITVRAGDCLWDIAAAELGPEATLREIDLRWRDWHRANRRVIGANPHLILPGTVLVTPVFSPHVPPAEEGP